MGETADVAVRVDAAAAVWVDLARLKPWVGNPRKNDENVARVAESIRRFGWGAPIVCRLANDEVIAGHTRAKACALLVTLWAKATERERATWSQDAVHVATRKQAPVRFMDLTEREAHLLALADNRLNELSPWDPVALHSAMTEYDFDDLSLAGWNSSDIDKLTAGLLEDASDAPGEAGAGELLGENGFKYESKYAVIVSVESEAEQERVYNELTGAGMRCKVVCV